MVDRDDEDLLKLTGIDHSNLDEQSDRETLKLLIAILINVPSQKLQILVSPIILFIPSVH